MKKLKAFLSLAVVSSMPVLAAGTAAKKAPAPTHPFKTKDQKVSYSIGQQLGTNFKAQGIGIEGKALLQGVLDAMAGKSQMTDQEKQQTLGGLQAEMQQKRMAEMKKRQETMKHHATDGETRLKADMKKGYKKTKSGLQYKVVKAGKGAKPSATDEVEVHYKGTYADGTKFDSSYDRGKPASFRTDGVIKGWIEGLQMMQEGSKYLFGIPYALAYGDRGNGSIPPKTPIFFEVELIKVKNKDKK